jgi:hypothetical protein
VVHSLVAATARRTPFFSRLFKRIDQLAVENNDLRRQLQLALEEHHAGPSTQSPSGHRAFDHAKAQEYEMRHAEQWLRENADWVWPLFDSARAGARDVHEIVFQEFFAGSRPLWEQFAHSLDGKALLDVGSGPVPAPSLWPWPARRYVIDPLAGEYDRVVRHIFGRSWFEGITLFAEPAEHNVVELNGKIDGAVYCRNCLDHCAEPYLVLSNLASYAAPGSALLLWTDLFHLDGPDAGHSNITPDRIGFRRLIENLGFTIIRETPEALGRNTINFGCFAIKQA